MSIALSAPTTMQMIFQATGVTTLISLVAFGPTGGEATFDNMSVKLLIPREEL